MPHTNSDNPFAFPPALLAELEAAADEQHRPVGDMLRELVERALQERRRAQEGQVPQPGTRVVFKMEDLDEAELGELTDGRMHPRHDHLNAELE